MQVCIIIVCGILSVNLKTEKKKKNETAYFSIPISEPNFI